MNQYKIIEPISDSDIVEYYKLRWLTLRKDWNQKIGSEKDISDKDSIHRMVVDKKGSVLAVGRLHYNSIIESQIRFMGVHPNYRRLGIGTTLLENFIIQSKLLGAVFGHLSVKSSNSEAIDTYLKNDWEIVYTDKHSTNLRKKIN